MMKDFLVLALIFVATTAFSQNHFIGMKGGFSWSNVHSKEISTDAFRTGFTLGITYENKIKQHLLIGGELLYQQKGYRVLIQWADGLGIVVDESDRTKFNYDYLSAPLKIGYVAGNKLSWFANIGLVPSILVKAEHILPEIFVDHPVDMTKHVRKFDLAGLAEMGGNVEISESLIISVALSYQHSITYYNSSHYLPDINAKHFGLILNCGVKYALR